MKSDLQRRNLNNENFIAVIKLRRNQNLLKDLLKNEIIEIGHQSGELKVIQKTNT